MFCPKCGNNVNDDARFCTACGNNMTEQQPQAPADSQQFQEPARSVIPSSTMARNAPKSNKGLKITLIAIIAVLVIGLIGVGAYFLALNTFNNASDLQTSECEECGNEFEGSGKLCDDCEEKEEKMVKCDECGTEFEGEGTLCADCKAALETPKKVCNQCGDEMVGDVLLCDECLGGIDYTENYEDGELSCFFCDTIIQEAEVAIVDTDGFVYCEDCDTENYCSDCSMPIEFDDDDTECQYCADFACASCDEVLTEEEIAGQDEEGYSYCENCWQ